MKVLGTLVVLCAGVLGLALVAQSGRAGSAYAALDLPPESADARALVGCLGEVERVRGVDFDPRDILELIHRLAQRLDKPAWSDVSSRILEVWHRLRDVPILWGDLARLNEALLPRFVDEGSVSDIARLIVVAEAKAFDGAAIEKTLEGAVGRPLPASGYPDSATSRIVAAAMKVGDFNRANAYLDKVAVSPDTPGPIGSDLVLSIRTAVGACTQAQTGRLAPMQVVTAWMGLDGDPAAREAIRPALEEIVSKAIGAAEDQRAQESVLGWMRQSPFEGVSFWDSMMARLRPTVLARGEVRERTFAMLASEYSSLFGPPEYGHRQWRQVYDLIVKAAPGDWLRQSGPLERAYASATNDLQRMETVEQLCDCLVKAKECGRAADAMNRARKEIQDTACLERLRPLAENCAARLRDDRDSVARQEKAISEQRRQSRVAALKERLETAKTYGRPESEIREVEMALENLQKEGASEH